MRSDLVVVATAIALASCAAPGELPAEGHLVIGIDTDAPLPSAAADNASIFDSVVFELVDREGRPACDDCTREVGLTREEVDRGATFVVHNRQPTILRARLFHSRLGVAARDPASVVEHWVRLPAPPAEGSRPILVTLPVSRVGLPLGSLASPTEPAEPGERLAPLPPEVARASGAAGEVCVTGGFFWMGDPRLPPEASAPLSPTEALGERSANVPRLVHITSFCVDQHEVTVGELRASGVDTKDVPAWSGTTDPSDLASFCSFTKARGPNDERAVNCVPWPTARAMCVARGMDLPSEAQLEYLGTSFGRSSFVWGHDPPACDEAFVGRAALPLSGDRSCKRGDKAPSLPATAATLSATRDTLATPGGSITGLASNVSEWTREEFAGPTAACKGPALGVALDPECAAKPGSTRIAVRGGNLASSPAECAAALRAYVVLPKFRPDLGFRCVR